MTKLRFSDNSRDCAKQHRSGVSKLAFDHAVKPRHGPATPAILLNEEFGTPVRYTLKRMATPTKPDKSGC